MQYFLCNYLGVISWGPKSKREVMEDLASPVWSKMGWFYLPETQVRYDGIRYVYGGLPVYGIRTIEDLESFEKEYLVP